MGILAFFLLSHLHNYTCTFRQGELTSLTQYSSTVLAMVYSIQQISLDNLIQLGESAVYVHTQHGLCTIQVSGTHNC